MAENNSSRPDSTGNKVKDPFTASAQRDAGLRAEMAASKAASLAKMAKLKALRVARDAELKAANPVPAGGSPGAAVPKKRKAAPKKG